MLQKFGQLITLIVTALTLVILLLFISEKNSYAKQEEVKQLVSNVEKNVNGKLNGIENLNGIDSLNEKYAELEKENKQLRTDLEELKKKLNKPKPQPESAPVSPSPAPEQPQVPEVLTKEKLSVIVPFLNFRDNPATSANVIATVPAGTMIEVLDKNVIDKDGYLWVKVGLQSGEVGYVVRGYVN